MNGGKQGNMLSNVGSGAFGFSEDIVVCELRTVDKMQIFRSNTGRSPRTHTLGCAGRHSGRVDLYRLFL